MPFWKRTSYFQVNFGNNLVKLYKFYYLKPLLRRHKLIIQKHLFYQYNNQDMRVRTRIAPSPTGFDLHLGNLYTALINYIWAKKNKGKFIVRIEDTDRQRVVAGSEERILSTLKQYGLLYDEGPDIGGEYGPYRQSERLAIYKKYALELVKKGKAYYCFCSKERLDEIRKKMLAEKKIPRYDGHCRSLSQKEIEKKLSKNLLYVIRLKVPQNQKIIVDDLLRGKVFFDSSTIDDQVLLKSDGYPTYHLAVVVDDYLMKINYVIRAEEWLSSTSKHILLYQAFNWPLPIFCHLPILRNPDRSKLSKRKNPVWASWYLRQGFLPEAVLNYLALMGWAHPEEKEIFSLKELIKVFDLKDIKTVGPVFDLRKLEWMNAEYIRKLKAEDLKLKILKLIGRRYQEKIVEKTIPLIQERIKKISDYLPLCQFFFEEPTNYEIDLDGKKLLLEKIYKSLSLINNWQAATIGENMVNFAKKEGIKAGDLFMILRVAVTGKTISPPLNESMEILGKKECLERIRRLF